MKSIIILALLLLALSIYGSTMPHGICEGISGFECFGMAVRR